MYKFRDLQRPRKMQEKIKTVLFLENLNFDRLIYNLISLLYVYYYFKIFNIKFIQLKMNLTSNFNSI